MKRHAGSIGAPPNFKVKSKRLAQQNDQVGAPRDLGEGAQRGVIEAARAFHDAGRESQRGFDPRQQSAPGSVGELRAGHEQRPFRRRR